jgi:hypothetical protein
MKLGGNRKTGRLLDMKKHKPDPDMFARLVLSDLASIDAEVVRTRIVVEIIARHLKIPNVEKLLEIHRIEAERQAREMAAEALFNVGFEDSPGKQNET